MEPTQKQSEAFQAVEDFLLSSPSDSGIVAMATGTGKTGLGSMIISSQAKRGQVGLWAVDRINLVRQAESEIQSHQPHLSIGVEMGKQRAGALRIYDVIVSTVQSISQRLDQAAQADYLIIDEAHQGFDNENYFKIYDYYAGKKRIGLTATPYGPLGQSIVDGNRWKKSIFEYSLMDAIRDGALCPIIAKMRKLEDIDLSRIDYTKRELSKKDTEEIERQILQEKVLKKMAEAVLEMPTPLIAFCPSTAISKGLAKFMNDLDPGSSLHIDCYMEEHLSGDAIKAFKSGKIKRVSNYRLWTYGIDLPNCRSVALCCDKNLVNYEQAIGRAVRWCCRDRVKSAGKSCNCTNPKDFGYVLDLADNYAKHTENALSRIVKNGSSELFREAFGKALSENSNTPLHELIDRILADPLIASADVILGEAREVEFANPMSELSERTRLIGFPIPPARDNRPARPDQISQIADAFFEAHENRKRESGWVTHLTEQQATALLGYLVRRKNSGRADPKSIWRLSHITDGSGNKILHPSVLLGMSQARSDQHWERHRAWIRKNKKPIR